MQKARRVITALAPSLLTPSPLAQSLEAQSLGARSLVLQFLVAQFLLVPCLLIAAHPGPAMAAPGPAGAARASLDHLWTLTAAALIFLMLAGFLMLRASTMRPRNALHAAQRSLLGLAISVGVFAAFGFMLTFGQGRPAGFDRGYLLLLGADAWALAVFTFQAMVCALTAAIACGAVAERLQLRVHMLTTVFIAGIVYPVFAHWSWGAVPWPNPGAFLAAMGFVDLAGATVVHATAGWLALAAFVVLGPHLDSLRADGGAAARLPGRNPVLAAMAALLLFAGWIGLNGGAAMAATPAIATIIANTVLAGCAGIGAGGGIGYAMARRKGSGMFPRAPIRGMIGGLVAVSAGCAVLTPPGAIAMGIIGAAAGMWASSLLQKRLRIDDAMGAVSVHAAAGVAGTLGVALLPAGGHLAQLGIQTLGAGLNFVWAFGAGVLFFRLIAMRLPLGLSAGQQAQDPGMDTVAQVLGDLVAGPLPVEPGDEAERLSALANATFEAICISSQGRIIDGNDAFGRLLGCPIETLKGHSLRNFVEPKDWERVSSHKGGDFGAPYEGTIRDINGHRIPIEVRAREITYRNAPARISAVIDLRERKQAEAQIRHLAQHDPLTNLPNRALFNERLTAMVEETRARHAMSAVVLIDLDRFKDINDLYGHAAGDDVLCEVSDRLRAETRSTDMVARLGGDEFAILVSPITFAAQAADLAHRLIARLSLSMTTAGGVAIRPGASIGVAICPRDGIEDMTLMTRADTALYHAKNNGRNRYAVFEKGMDAEIRRRQELEMYLEQAVDRDEFELYFQPRMDVVNGRIASYEALIRWHHPEKGIINPADFIPVAENSGRIIAIGEWAMRRACEIAAHDLEGRGISVNVSPMQFREKTFVDMVLRVIHETGITPGRLEIEITESLLIDDDQRAIAMLDALKAEGVRVALDDFGTGYSSLGYLSRFPFDTIKIDRSFVDDMQSDENAMAIIETIIRLGRALDMSIVAEGVENPEALRVLTEKGCDEIQGFVLGRPLPLAQRVREVPPAILDVVQSVHQAAARSLDAKGLQKHTEHMLTSQGESDPERPDPRRISQG